MWHSLSQGLELVGVDEYYLSALSRQSLMKLIVLGCLGLSVVPGSLARMKVAVATVYVRRGRG